MDMIQEIIQIGEFEQYSEIEGIPQEPSSLYKFVDKEMERKFIRFSLDDKFNFIKGLALIEFELADGGWGAGSTTPVARLFRRLEKSPSIPKEKIDELAKWLLEHRSNPYIPYGHQV